MQQVGDGEINLEQGISEQEAQNWSTEYVYSASKDDSDLLAQKWAKEHAAETGKNTYVQL